MKSFEERLTRLEELSEKIKDGNIPLEEAVALFEEGINLAKGLEKELAADAWTIPEIRISTGCLLACCNNVIFGDDLADKRCGCTATRSY